MVISRCVGDLLDTTLELNWNITSLFLVMMMSGLSGELEAVEVGMFGSESLKKRTNNASPMASTIAAYASFCSGVGVISIQRPYLFTELPAASQI
jgi:hypothetical protein